MASVTLITKDGYHLIGRWTRAKQAKAVLLVHGATGVPAGYYKAFAEWCASERDLDVFTYDYRDCGASATISAKNSNALMSDWVIYDQPAALDYVLAEAGDLPVWTVGHSLGGKGVPFHQNADRITRHIAVAAGPAHWRKHPWRFTPQVIMFWFILGPMLTALLGYTPGRILGINADLPAPVFWQWRRWCTSQGFFQVDWGTIMPHPDLTRMTGHVDLIGLTDDVMIPPERVAKLADLYPAAQVHFREIAPHEVGLKSIGHIAAFGRRNAALWPELVPYP